MRFFDIDILLIHIFINFSSFYSLLRQHSYKLSSLKQSWKYLSQKKFPISLYSQNSDENYNVALIVPTGVGARIGGYAGDALPIARLFSSIVGDQGRVITHPNVMNGAMLYYPMKNVLYVEGYALDEFAKGHIALEPMNKKSQKIGVLLDKNIESSLQIRHVQVIDAVRATLGIDVSHVVITSRPVIVSIEVAPSGASWGSIQDTDTLVEAAQKLITNGCTAIAVIVRFPEDDEIEASSDVNSAAMFAAYRQGDGVDAIAGVEALISHIITQKFLLPCAHAPAFAPMDPDSNVSPKACAEEIGYTFLPCVLANLHKAPNLIRLQDSKTYHPIQSNQILTCHDVDSVIVPYNALGGSAVLSFLSQDKLIVAVLENETSMQVESSDLFPPSLSSSLSSHPFNINRNIVIVRSYAEAAGVIAAHKEGILLTSITSQVKPLEPKHC